VQEVGCEEDKGGVLGVRTQVAVVATLGLAEVQCQMVGRAAVSVM